MFLLYYLEELSINKIIIHILDSSLTMPILSMEEMTASNEANDFFANHIIKIMNDDGIKTCVFNEDYNMFYSYLKDYQNDENKFVDFTLNVANQLFAIMTSNTEIPPSDLAIIGYHYKGTKYVALLKMNYQNTYIHYTDYENDININTIIKYRTTLPSPSQKINEAIIINLSTLEINILEKKYDIDGVKAFYLSEFFLKCTTKLSSKEQYNIVKKATDNISKKYFDEDIEKKMSIKQQLYNNIEETGEIDLNKFASEVFKTNESLKEEFKETLEKKGLEEPLIQLQEKTIIRSFDKQKIKTDNGIEINIPMELYNDPKNLEFITNPNGTISIVIKNVNKILG